MLVTAGHGYYQEYGKNIQLLGPGDVINIEPGVKHWHGATKSESFQHLAVEVPCDNGYTEWCEPVNDEEYSKIS